MLSFSNIFANIAFALGLYTVVTNYQKNIKNAVILGAVRKNL